MQRNISTQLETPLFLPASEVNWQSYYIALCISLAFGVGYLAWPDMPLEIVGGMIFLAVVTVFSIRFSNRHSAVVFLSPLGLRGRPVRGVTWSMILWGDSLVEDKDSSNGFDGFTFTSIDTGSAVFIPASIFKSKEFVETARKLSPAEHLLNLRNLR